MSVAADDSFADFSELDNAGISKQHWKIMLISGMGFFTDAYDLFIIAITLWLLQETKGRTLEELSEADARAVTL